MATAQDVSLDSREAPTQIIRRRKHKRTREDPQGEDEPGAHGHGCDGSDSDDDDTTRHSFSLFGTQLRSRSAHEMAPPMKQGQL